MSNEKLSKRIGHTLAVFQHLSDLSLEWALKKVQKASEAAPEENMPPDGWRAKIKNATKFTSDLWETYVSDYGKMKRK